MHHVSFRWIVGLSDFPVAQGFRSDQWIGLVLLVGTIPLLVWGVLLLTSHVRMQARRMAVFGPLTGTIAIIIFYGMVVAGVPIITLRHLAPVVIIVVLTGYALQLWLISTSEKVRMNGHKDLFEEDSGG